MIPGRTVERLLRILALWACLGASILFLLGPAGSEIASPWKNVKIGAFDAAGWCGLVLAPHKEAAFAFRFQVEKDGQEAEGHDLFYLASEIGPNSPDGLYARIGFDLGLPILAERKNETPILMKPVRRSNLLILEWSRQDERAVVGRLTIPKNTAVRLLPYFPWDFKGRFRASTDGDLFGEAVGQKKAAFVLWTNRDNPPAVAGDGSMAVYSYSAQGERTVYFAVGVGDQVESIRRRIYRYKNARTIDVLLEEERDRYEKKRVIVEGLFSGAAEAVTNSLHWMMLYQPGSHRLYVPSARTRVYGRDENEPDDWRISAADSFLTTLGLSLESAQSAAEAFRAVLETQYPNGNLPGWRSRSSGAPDRSQPPLGAYVLLKLFGKSGDRSLLETAYPVLRRSHAYWKDPAADGKPRRDRNGDGLLEWGSDIKPVGSAGGAAAAARARSESGQDDLPNWDDIPVNSAGGTQILNAVDLNSLYALDALCLAQIADILDRQAERDAYLDEYELQKKLVNDILWNSRENFYFDRFWDGRFSSRKAASNFFPMLARIPDDRRAQLIRRHLLDPKEFWGDFLIPTVSRDDPAFLDPGNPSRQAWRGAIRPAANYLVYQGLKSYGFDAEASEFARKSAGLVLNAWHNFQLSPESYHPLSGEAAGLRFQSLGPLLALIAVEEYLDFTPGEGVRFGMISPEEDGRVSRISIQGHHYGVSVSRKKIVLTEEDRPIVAIDGGAVVRHFLYAENEVSFDLKTMAERKVRITFLRKGKYQLEIDNVPKRVFKGSKVAFDVPDGNHTILLQLLEALD
ncbi:MAG: hypothetical protein JW843_04865 [Candidatus Aminicenantes bacterium]|nr:hypothetical protein [Candidatus Aminicenantes bacterium]